MHKVVLLMAFAALIQPEVQAQASKATPTLHARVVALGHEARYRSREGTWQPLTVGTMVHVGDAVRSSKLPGSFVDLMIESPDPRSTLSGDLMPLPGQTAPASLRGADYLRRAGEWRRWGISRLRLRESSLLVFEKLDEGSTNDMIEVVLDVQQGKLDCSVADLNSSSSFKIRVDQGEIEFHGRGFWEKEGTSVARGTVVSAEYDGRLRVSRGKCLFRSENGIGAGAQVQAVRSVSTGESLDVFTVRSEQSSSQYAWLMAKTPLGFAREASFASAGTNLHAALASNSLRRADIVESILTALLPPALSDTAAIWSINLGPQDFAQVLRSATLEARDFINTHPTASEAELQTLIRECTTRAIAQAVTQLGLRQMLSESGQPVEPARVAEVQNQAGLNGILQTGWLERRQDYPSLEAIHAAAAFAEETMFPLLMREEGKR